MAAGCKTTVKWTNFLTRTPLQLLDACDEGMETAMAEVARRARPKARWNPDGTDTGKWIVTGTARRSITGYSATPGVSPPYQSFYEREPKYGDIHSSPQDNDLQDVNPAPGHVVGVLTMTEQHSKYLQTYEMGGARTSRTPLSGMGPNESITTSAIRDDEDYIWETIRKVISRRVKL